MEDGTFRFTLESLEDTYHDPDVKAMPDDYIKHSARTGGLS